MCLILSIGHFHCDQFWQPTLRLWHKSECHLICVAFLDLGHHAAHGDWYLQAEFPFKMLAKLLADKVFTDQLRKEQRNVTSKGNGSPPLPLHALHKYNQCLCLEMQEKRTTTKRGGPQLVDILYSERGLSVQYWRFDSWSNLQYTSGYLHTGVLL